MVAINLAICFLALTGALLALFEWTAAKRREFLYLYMTAGKPDSEYFQSARRRRRQFIWTLLTFLLLSFKEILFTSVLYHHRYPMQLDWRPVASIAPILLLAEILVVVLLGYAFLAEREAGLLSQRRWVVGNCALLIVLLAAVSALHPIAHAVPWIYRAYLCLVLATTISFSWRGGQENRVALVSAFGMLLIGPLMNTMVYYRIATLSAYVLFDALLLQSIVEQYEKLELDRHRLDRERQTVIAFLETMANAFNTAFDLDQVLEIIMRSSLRATNATSGAIFLADKSGRLQAKTSRGFFPPMYDDTEPPHRARRTELLRARMLEQEFHLGEGIIGEVAKTGQPKLIEDVRKTGIMTERMTEFMRNRSMVLVPLIVQNKPLGVMAVLNKETATPFTSDDVSTLQALADHAAFAIRNAAMVSELAEKERIDRELQIAHQIQKQLLPKECPELPGFELAALGEAAQEVGGDYYDFFWADKDRLGIVVADVSGKGVPAAMTMAITRSIFRSQSSENRTAREVVTMVNALLYPDLRRDMFVTAFYGILDVRNRTLAWCRAGHEPVIAVYSGGKTEVIAPSGAALGIAEEAEFNQIIEERQIQFSAGDTLLIYTDGITEAMNSAGEEFGIERLKSTISSDGAPDGSALVKKVENAIRSFVGPAPQQDDMTLVLVRAK